MTVADERIEKCAASLKKWLPEMRRARDAMQVDSVNEQVETMETALWICDTVVPLLQRNPVGSPEAEVQALRLAFVEFARVIGGSIAIANSVVDSVRRNIRLHSGSRTAAELYLVDAWKLLNELGVQEGPDGGIAKSPEES